MKFQYWDNMYHRFHSLSGFKSPAIMANTWVVNGQHSARTNLVCKCVSVDAIRHGSKRPTSSDFVLMKTMKIQILFYEYAVIYVYRCIKTNLCMLTGSTRIWFLPLRSQSTCRVGVLCRSRSMRLFVHMSLYNGGSNDRLDVCVCVWQVPVETSYRLTAQCSPWHLNSS